VQVRVGSKDELDAAAKHLEELGIALELTAPKQM
jgi:hypothetical protein